MMPSPPHSGQAPSELALNRAGMTPFGLGEQLADGVEHARVGGRVGPAGAAGGGLVDDDRCPGTAWAGRRGSASLAGARHAGDDGEDAARDVDGHVLQVVQGGARERQRTGRRAHVRLQRLVAGEVVAGQRAGGPQPVRSPA